MQSLIRSKSAGVTGGRGTAGAGPGRDLPYARHEYKQGWKFLTLWDGYGLSEATWEPMSAFIQPDGSINPIFRSYLVENN